MTAKEIQRSTLKVLCRGSSSLRDQFAKVPGASVFNRVIKVEQSGLEKAKEEPGLVWDRQKKKKKLHRKDLR
jgi:hypothetical protein